MTDEQPSTLKEALFNPEIVTEFASAIHRVYPAFPQQMFLDDVFDDSWSNRGLMDRMRHVTKILRDYLPGDYRAAVHALIEAQPHMPAGGFINMVPADFVAVYGLEDPDTSIPALEQFTQLASAEFAVRPFIVEYPQRMMAQMLRWATHDHEGVRRLASEGCRPRLPWGIRLQGLVDAPTPIIPILEKLKHDPSESVRRSVANNLNDISKDNPQVTIRVLQQWNSDEGGDERIKWITGHALRTLVKNGDSDALELLGYPADPNIVVREVMITPIQVAIGEKILLSYEIESTGDRSQNLMIDYVVYHMRANGKQTPKVFKHRKLTIAPGEVVKIKKSHSFKPVTTRKYYPGSHGIQPQVNGKLFDRVDFEITNPSTK